MNKSTKKVPKLRFKGFTDDWEHRKWLDTVDISNNMVDPNSGNYDKLPHVGPGNIESFTGRLLNNVRTVKEDKLISGKFHFHKGDIIYGKINPQLGKYIYSPYEGLASADAYVLTTKNGLDRNFLFVLLQTNHFYQYSVSVSMRSGMPKINRNELNMYSFTAPLEVEQEKIGLYFFKLDAMIALHQRKLDALKRLKEAYLQNMFPKKGQSVPLLRFANFEGGWEQRKLGDHAEILTGGTPKTQIKKYWEPKEIPWMSSGEVNKKRLKSTDNMISIEGFENSSARWVKEKSVLIALAGQGKTRGTVAINEISLTTNQSIAAIVPKEELCYEFVFQNLEKRYEELRLVSSGDGTRGGLNKKLVSELVIISPSIVEQFKISSLLKQLDNTITLHQQKLKQLQNLKTAYLQKMFI